MVCRRPARLALGLLVLGLSPAGCYQPRTPPHGAAPRAGEPAARPGAPPIPARIEPVATGPVATAAAPRLWGTTSADGAAPAPPSSRPPTPEPAAASYPFQAPLPAFDAAAPAMRLANLSVAECRQELARRGLPVTPHKTNAGGIGYALRITGPMHGVTFVTARAPSPYGLLDCRLALALDELAQLLGAFEVSEVHIGSMYRKNARIAGRRKRSQHAHGLAMDVATLRLQGGRLLSVERDFHGRLGAAPCGPRAEMTDPDDGSIALRNIVCAVVRSGLFHHVLTPCADRAHRNHLHFDLQRDASHRWAK